MLRRVLSAALFAFVLVACASSPSGPSQGSPSTTCSTTADCNTGLSCLGFAQFDDAGCTEVGKACSTPCQTDADCAKLGPKQVCFAGCGATKFCGATP